MTVEEQLTALEVRVGNLEGLVQRAQRLLLGALGFLEVLGRLV